MRKLLQLAFALAFLACPRLDADSSQSQQFSIQDANGNIVLFIDGSGDCIIFGNKTEGVTAADLTTEANDAATKKWVVKVAAGAPVAVLDPGTGSLTGYPANIAPLPGMPNGTPSSTLYLAGQVAAFQTSDVLNAPPPHSVIVRDDTGANIAFINTVDPHDLDSSKTSIPAGSLVLKGYCFVYTPGYDPATDTAYAAGGDGHTYTNRDEWAYLSLFFPDQLDVWGNYLSWIFDQGSTPPANATFTPNADGTVTVGGVPTTTVTIAIEGDDDGSADTSGDTAAPGAGSHQFATYAMGTSNTNWVTFTATPVDTDHVFLNWRVDGPDLQAIAQYNFMQLTLQGTFTTPSLAIPMGQDCDLTAVFDYRPGVANLDLVSDLGQFLVAAGEASSATDPGVLTWDRGGVIENDDGTETYTGNGIPDAAELYLLQTILQNTMLDLAQAGGVSSLFANQDWAQNLYRVQHYDLPNQPAAVQRAVAAYMTLGYGEIMRWVESLVAASFVDTNGNPVILDETNYSINSARYLAPFGDADNDGWNNAQEWNYVVPSGGSSGMAAFSSYAQYATDPTVPGGTPTTSGGYAMNASAPGSYAADASSPSGTTSGNCTSCPNNDYCVGPCTINLQNGTDPNNGAIIVSVSGTSDDCNAQTLNVPGTTSVLAGHSVTVSAQNQQATVGVFSTWSAPGLPIDGSEIATETFVAPGGASCTITPQYTSTAIGSMTLSSDHILSDYTLSVGGTNASATRLSDQNGNYAGYSVQSQAATLVSASFSSSCGPALGWGLYDNGTIGDCENYEVSVILPDAGVLNEIDPSIASYLPTNLVTHRATSTQGVPWIAAGGLLSQARFCYTLTTTPDATVSSSCGLGPGVEQIPVSYSWVGSTVNTITSGKTVWHHKFGQQSTLRLENTPCKGYATASPAQKYYPAPFLDGSTTGTMVAITANPLPGYKLLTWPGTGYYLDSAGTQSISSVYDFSTHQVLTSTSPGTVYVKMGSSRDICPKFGPDDGANTWFPVSSVGGSQFSGSQKNEFYNCLEGCNGTLSETMPQSSLIWTWNNSQTIPMPPVGPTAFICNLAPPFAYNVIFGRATASNPNVIYSYTLCNYRYVRLDSGTYIFVSDAPGGYDFAWVHETTFNCITNSVTSDICYHTTTTILPDWYIALYPPPVDGRTTSGCPPVQSNS